MTLSEIQGHPPIASLFKCDFSYSSAAVDKIFPRRRVARSLLR